MAEDLAAGKKAGEVCVFSGSTQPQVCAAAVCALSPERAVLNVFAIGKDLELPEIKFGEINPAGGIDLL